MQRVLPLICLMLVWQVSSLLIHPTKIAIQPTKESHHDDIPAPKYKLFEGDIRMPADFDPVKLSQEESQEGELGYRTKRNAVADRGLLWPGGIIPYTISNRFNRTSKNLFRQSMKTIEDMTKINGKKCIQFVPRSDEDNFIHLEMLRNCWSELGRVGEGRQNVSLGIQCHSLGTVMHELIHALGFYHEQSRADRDYYINVHWDNIKKGAEYNFQKYKLGTSIDHLNQPYDYDSIMHYGPDSFAQAPSKPTISTKIKLTNGVQIGQRDHLSVIDIKMIQKLYSCDKNGFAGRDPNGPCFDKLEHCNLYGKRACDQLPKWAEENCAVTCGICTPDCSDKRTDCSNYDKEQICVGEWKDWGEQNCAKFCGLGDCQYITTPKPAAVCADKIDDCADYQGDFCNKHKAWSAENCPRYCNFCHAEVTTIPTAPPCQDLMDCSHFPTSVCTLSTMKTNCARHCKLCSDNAMTLPLKTTPTTRKPTTTKGVDVCKDDINDCHDYSRDACKDYPYWANKSCRLYCGLCKASATTTPAPTTTQQGACEDMIDDCSAYDSSVCADYPNWSKTNCRQFCGLCDNSEVTTPTSTPAPTTTQRGACEDTIDDCSAYDASVCKDYPNWSKTNCRQFCGLCDDTEVTTATSTPAPTTTQQGACKDTIDDCSGYDASVCEDYPNWSKTNCRQFCGLCDNAEGMPTTVTSTVAPTTQQGACKDMINDCSSYDANVCQEYPGWSKTNCRHFCGLCDNPEESAESAETAETARPACVDTLSNCAEYTTEVCTSYAAWAKTNCAQFCGQCD